MITRSFYLSVLQAMRAAIWEGYTVTIENGHYIARGNGETFSLRTSNYISHYWERMIS